MTNLREVRHPVTCARGAAVAAAAFLTIMLGLATAPRCQAQALTTLYNFCSQSNCTDGQDPRGLIEGSDGNFYGTTYWGGTGLTTYGTPRGTVFKLTPAGALTVLHSFCSQANCTDGSWPLSGLVQGSDGNFYGTTGSGGANPSCGVNDPDCGTIFKITPTGMLTTLYTFCSQTGCTDGRIPSGPLVQGSDGNFYGTTQSGGANSTGEGTIFSITPTGTLTPLYSFCKLSGCADGQFPNGPLVQGGNGNYYGTTPSASYNSSGGTIFSITPGGTLTTLYSFCLQSGCNDGQNPAPGLIRGTDGNFFGTTEQGGANPAPVGSSGGSGTVFKITPSGKLATLYSFCSVGGTSACTDGAFPIALIQDTDGNFVGITEAGGASALYGGTSFRLTPPPVVTIAPLNLSFGNQNVETTSASQPVTVSNIGAGPLNISGIGVSGDFAQTNVCGGSVAEDTSCTLNVTFTPTAPGARTGSLTITDNNNAVAGSTQTVGLSGTGTGAGFSGTIDLFPTYLSTGYQAIGTTSSPKPFVVRNSGTGPLTNLSVSTTGDFAASSMCPTMLNAGASCKVDVTFTPTALGSRTGTVIVAGSTVNSPQTVAVTGTGVAPVTLTPASAGFPMRGAGGPATFTLHNSAPSALNHIAIATTGDFAVTSTTCGTSLAAMSDCTIDVSYTATQFGAYYGTLTVSDSANNSPQVSKLNVFVHR